MNKPNSLTLRGLLGSGLLAKFLIVLVPAFVLLALPALAVMVNKELHGDRDALAARMGNLAARTAVALGRHDVVGDPQLASDLMAPLATDRAFLCAELRVAGTDKSIIGLPQGLGCTKGEGGHDLLLPVGEDGEMALMLRFSEVELVESRQKWHGLVFAVLFVSIICAVIAATIGFRFIVGAPLARFTEVIRTSIKTGHRARVDITRNDEIGRVIAAFDDMQDRDENRETEMRRTYEALTESEGKLRRLNEELEDRVACRTAELRAQKGKAQADRDYLSAVLETVADAIVATNEQGQIQSLNRAAESLFGYRDDEVLGSHVARLVPSQIGRSPIASMARAQSVGRIRISDNSLQTTGRTRDGVEFPLEITVSEMRHGGSRVYISVVRDITERLEYERRLIAAKEEAESANRSKSHFLANMSHELRTPLNAVIGFSEAMQQQIMGPLGHRRYNEYVNDIHASGEHLLHLINTILDFSKIEAGAESLEERDISVSGLVEECVRMVRHRCERSGIRLGVDSFNAPLAVRADHTKLKQILVNLLSNAVKFTPPGGWIEVRAHVTQGGRLEISVSDTGIGMAADQIPLALQRFGQVENAFARRFEGTGLGLPLAKALAELHDGWLRIESELEKGTTVTLTLPSKRIVGGTGKGGKIPVHAGLLS